MKFTELEDTLDRVSKDEIRKNFADYWSNDTDTDVDYETQDYDYEGHMGKD